MGELNSLTDEPAFLAVSGDLTQNATDPEFVRYQAAMATSRVPVWPAVGNHDISDDSDVYDNYRKYLGPEWYSFDYGNRHFVMLENNSASTTRCSSSGCATILRRTPSTTRRSSSSCTVP